MSEVLSVISLVLVVAGLAAGVAWFFAEQFKVMRHDMVGRFNHRDRRLLRIELWLKDKLGFDMSSDLPPDDDKK